VKTSDLIGPALDWAVAKCEGVPVEAPGYVWEIGKWVNQYSTDWAQGGPIIEREGIDLVKMHGSGWHAELKRIAHGPTPLIAAMRAYVASKLGDEVEIPVELL
jgi:hypothetical protein